MKKQTICTLCGLACEEPLGCHRAESWHPSYKTNSVELDEYVRQAALELARAGRPLFWLDAADVRTVRSIVKLAQACEGTIHVGQSTGLQCLKRVMKDSGWLTTTLAEVADRADLVVSIGNNLLQLAPLLQPRFIAPSAAWLHVADSPRGQRHQGRQPKEVVWPRDTWFDRLTELVLLVRSGAAPNGTHPQVDLLLKHLQSASNIVWLWDIDEMHFDTDELIIRRLVSLAQLISESTSHQARCRLLPIDNRVGRVSAEETLLWLTGCSTTAKWNGQRWWSMPRWETFDLRDWSREFDVRWMISNVPSEHHSPNIEYQRQLHWSANSSDASWVVTGVGWQERGHLFRGDRGMLLFTDTSEEVDANARLASASEIIELVRRELLRLRKEGTDAN